MKANPNKCHAITSCDDEMSLKLLISFNWCPLGAAEIFECVCKYVDGISQNLQILSPC